MSDKAAGWYPDPDGENRQRYWDGDSWTDYFTPIAPAKAELHGAATATADYPYLAATRGGPHPGLMARPSAPVSPASTGGWPTAAPGVDDDGTLEFNGGGRRSGGSRWMLALVSVLIVTLVVTLGIWLLGGGGDDDPTGGSPVTGPTGPVPTSSGDPVALDGSSSGDVGAFGIWESSLSLAADTLLQIDVRAERSGADLQVTLRPQGGGDPVATNDDRGSALANTSGNALDPLLIATVAAGDYDLVVENRDGAATGFDLTAAGISTELSLGTRADGTVPDDGVWAATLTIPSDGDYRVDVVGVSAADGGEPDALLVLVGPGGEQLLNDDRGSGDPDPLLEQTLSAGTWVVLVSDYRGRSIDFHIEATTA